MAPRDGCGDGAAARQSQAPDGRGVRARERVRLPTVAARSGRACVRGPAPPRAPRVLGPRIRVQPLLHELAASERVRRDAKPHLPRGFRLELRRPHSTSRLPTGAPRALRRPSHRRFTARSPVACTSACRSRTAICDDGRRPRSAGAASSTNAMATPSSCGMVAGTPCCERREWGRWNNTTRRRTTPRE